MHLHLGMDIGSVSIDTVLMDGERNIITTRYDLCQGRPFYLLKQILLDITKTHGSEALNTVAFTGTGGQEAQKLLGGHYVNEIVAQASSVAHLYPDAKCIIEMGGEDSKLIYLEHTDGKPQLRDFTMNSICAAGTGSFLDQQAKRLGISIEKEFGELALKSKNPPRIAGRCSVFAKSDMIHLQQIATPLHDIVAGLCFAVARNFKSQLASGKNLPKPVVFQGGVAANRGMIKAFGDIFNLQDDDLIVPNLYAFMGAIGALYYLFDNIPEKSPYKGLEELEKYLEEENHDQNHLEPLSLTVLPPENEKVFTPDCDEKLDVYLGLDVGSLSTNVVLIDNQNRVIARRYLPTRGRPLEAIREGLSQIFQEVGEKVVVKAAGTTGSGRYLTGDFIGADLIQNEITSQATAAIDIDPLVDTIFEIGGQDSKFISLDNGVVVDFEMNKVCAAGTGSFLEEQAEKLGVNIICEFGEIALNAPSPSKLGDRCTVFMESDLNSHQQKGVKKENLVAGLAYSIAYNYLQKVVGNKRIGNRIFFQGGVASNRAVVAAFEKITGKKITVPPHHDITGAIGAAILAHENMGEKKTRFKGFSVSSIPYSVNQFTCRFCENHCEIRKVKIEGEKKPLFFGGRCERYEIDERKGKGKGIPNLFTERLKLILGDYRVEPADERLSIGIPRGLMLFYQMFPFWYTFFKKLGFRVVLSPPSNHELIARAVESITAETCFPVEVMHGHVYSLLDEKIDYVFLPSIINSRTDNKNPTKNYNCPWIQTVPYMLRASIEDQKASSRLLTPVFHFRYFGKVLNREICSFMKKTFGFSGKEVLRAVEDADRAQKYFETRVRELGRETLKNLPETREVVVIMGRPYNTGDPQLNLDLVSKLINLDVFPIPMDFLPLEDEDIFGDYKSMYWPNGKNIIAAARIIAKNEKLQAVYLGNFRCGPDSFIHHFVREEMGDKPYLQLEVDEHSADAGIKTRLEAFLDSLKSRKQKKSHLKKYPDKKVTQIMLHAPVKERILYFPYMCDHAYILHAALKLCNINSEVLPPTDEKALELGRKYTSSRECFPMICTTGSFLKKALEPGFDPRTASFFMPDHNGPCRFGQYNRMQKVIFHHLGLEEVEIVSPGNSNAYRDLWKDEGFRILVAAWKGIVAVDLLRKLLQERRPYELKKGESDTCYRRYLQEVINCVSTGAQNIVEVMEEAAEAFKNIEVKIMPRKPVISVTGEIFMRDNPFCSGHIIEKLEKLGAETLIAPIREWLHYSAYRYRRDSRWERNIKGILISRLQEFFQHHLEKKIHLALKDKVDLQRDIPLSRVLQLCTPYIDNSYDGEPALIMGTTTGQVSTGISGVVNILPFTCLPGTVVSSLSGLFRKDHENIPWINIAYDGQEETGIETRLQAFMHQAVEYCEKKGFNHTT